MIFRRRQADDATEAGRLPRVAVLTMVRDEGVMLPRWIAHYSAQVGVDALVVIDDNSSDGSTDDLPCTVLRIPPLEVKGFEPARMGLASGIAQGLLNAYDAVLLADADEFVVADPAKYPTIRHLLADRPDRDVLGVTTLNVIHDVAHEPPLRPDEPLLAQRRLAKFIPLMCKPSLKRVPAAWAHASHGIFAPYTVDPDLWMFHFKFADRDLLQATADHRRRMVEMDGRARSTSWRQGGDVMVELLDRINAGIVRDEVREFSPPVRKLAKIVEPDKERKGMFRATGQGQIAAMENQPVVAVPERFRTTV
ncbi:glycosyltransferase family 2 protein [Nocardioides caldifontis]|uniref:glycosyltransferase family 2 protein n=1 Tax=Nocardioides caldifontis TaxID=2588938 RepID=UPI0011E0360C|nr:glycosyltransferase family 2 protein [Nocardioides caldifontis]